MKFRKSVLALSLLIASGLSVCTLAATGAGSSDEGRGLRADASRDAKRSSGSNHNNALQTTPRFRAVGPEVIDHPQDAWVAQPPFGDLPLLGAHGQPGGDGVGMNAIASNQPPEGDLPRHVAILGNNAFATQRETDNLFRYNVNLQTVTGSVAVGDFPIDLVIANNKIYVGNTLDNTVSVVNPTTMAVITTVQLSGTAPHTLTTNAAGTRVFVGMLNDPANSIPSSVDVINTATDAIAFSFNTVPHFILVQPFDNVSGVFVNKFTPLVFDPAGNRLLIPDASSTMVGVYDATNGAETLIDTTITTPVAIDVNAAGDTAYVAHEDNQQAISVLNLASNMLDTVIFTSPRQLANQIIRLTPDETQLFVTTIDAGGVGDTTVVQISNQLQTPLNIGGSFEFLFPNATTAFCAEGDATFVTLPSLALNTVDTPLPHINAEAAMNATGTRIVTLSNRRNESLNFYDSSAQAYIATIQSGNLPESDTPTRFAISDDGNTVVAANLVSGNAVLYDLTGFGDGASLSFVPTGDGSLGCALSPDGTTAAVCNSTEDTVSIIDVASGTNLVDIQILTGFSPIAPVFSADNQFLYFCDLSGASPTTVFKVDVNGAGSAIVGQLTVGTATGGTGGITFPYVPWNNMAINTAGTRLAVPMVFGNATAIINSTNMTLVGNVISPPGAAPHRAAWNGSRFFVTHSLAPSGVIKINPAGPVLENTYPVASNPADVIVDGANGFAYVPIFDGTLGIINTTANTTSVIAAPDILNDAELGPDSVLYATGIGANAAPALHRFNAAGFGTTLIDSLDLNDALGTPFGVHVSNAISVGGGPRVAVTQPRADTLEVLGAGPSGAVLNDFSITFGSLNGGGLADLFDSDDSRLLVNSQFGFSAGENNILQVQFGFEGVSTSATTLDFLYEGHIDNPGGTGRVFVRNFSTNMLEQVATFAPVQGNDTVHQFVGIDATDRVSAGGRTEVEQRQAVVATFAASGFEARHDQVVLSAN